MAAWAGHSSVRPQRGGNRNWYARAVWIALAVGMLAGAAPAARAARSSGIRIVAIEPMLIDSTLRCVVRTTGLPDGPTRETLDSGLPASLTLSLALLDASGRERSLTQSEVRMEPDPWERTFLLRQPQAQQRVSDMDALAAALQRLGPIAVASVRMLDSRTPMRIRVRLSVHPLAPAEADRAHALFAGDLTSNGGDRREVSAGMGSLLRFFLGRAPASDWDAQATSAPFTARALQRAPR